jgi:hypothetical protein
MWQVEALSILTCRRGGAGAKTARSLLIFVVIAAANHAHMMVSYCMFCIEITITNTRVSVQSSELAPPTPSLANECSSPPTPRDPSGGEPHSFIKTHVTIMIKKKCEIDSYTKKIDLFSYG